MRRWDKALLRAVTTGASAATARQDKIPHGGVWASHQLAERDLPQVLKYAPRFISAADRWHVPAALLAALASRESRCGAVLKLEGDAFGIMQVDRRFHEIVGTRDPASLEHIEQAAGILAANLKLAAGKHPDWSDEHLLKAAVVAYNAGIDTVRTIEEMDRGTTNHDYGADVIARAQYYYRHYALEELFRS